MKYLTEKDLENFEFEAEDQDFLKKAVRKAEELLDVVTRRFYEGVSFQDDVEWRKSAVRRAVLAQVEYFIETGETSAEGLNSTPQSVSIGRTTVTTVGSRNSAGKITKNLTCDEFLLHLSGTGLLYRGVER